MCATSATIHVDYLCKIIGKNCHIYFNPHFIFIMLRAWTSGLQFDKTTLLNSDETNVKDFASFFLAENEEKDTKEEDALAVTFQAKLSTFEMDIMKENNIEEDRVPAKSFWY